MTITTVSNYINHHQIPLSNEFYKTLGEGYHFIQTEPMEEERIKMGWGAQLQALPYLLNYWKEEKRAGKLIMESDIVIFGGVEEESYIEERLQAGKPVIRSSERLYKNGQWKAISPRGLKKKYHDHTRYRKSPVYLLCNGGYVAADFSLVHAYPDKMFSWGYFPKIETYEWDSLYQGKKKEIPELLWVGRFVDFKCPWYVPKLAKRLKEEHIKAHITMIGSGELENRVLPLIEMYDVQDVITHLPFQKPGAIRDYMKKADIYLFTSDFGEGWGAVANEAMNSGCALVANRAAGATPALCKSEENALIYQNKDFEGFCRQVIRLVQNPKLRESLGKNAYETMVTLWNAPVAAERLLVQCERILAGKPVTFEKEGPMSKAEILKHAGVF